MISPCYNFRMTAILENWIDLTLLLNGFLNIKDLLEITVILTKQVLKGRKAIMSMTYGGNWFSIQTWFQNIPFRRIKKMVF